MMELPGVVPASARFLGPEDKDGNQLWRVTAMKDQCTDYQRVLKKNGYQAQQFDYDAEQYMADRKLEAKLKIDNESLNKKILQTTYHNFNMLFQSLLHLKIMRTFVDGVLRFGIPPKFFIGILKPNKNQDKKIMKKLEDSFAEDYLKDMNMYGAKEDAQDEDFFPYISNTLAIPAFLQ